MRTLNLTALSILAITFACGNLSHAQTPVSYWKGPDASPVLVMSVHGGWIEPGTSELANSIFDLISESPGGASRYSYEQTARTDGLNEEWLTDNTFHLTSAKFTDPLLLNRVGNSDTCISIHGFGGWEADFCVGGGNEALPALLVRKLEIFNADLKGDFKTCELCCKPFDGLHKKNPVNLCKNKGAQVEMSARVRRLILADESFKKALAESFVSAVSALPAPETETH